mmetsp:Transcript_35827/g.102411  ORF Transcript_35827/g.102411 Transcript_35827/m.102411 type:complete len:200 (+) Transcript_35827:209-808(+)
MPARSEAPENHGAEVVPAPCMVPLELKAPPLRRAQEGPNHLLQMLWQPEVGQVAARSHDGGVHEGAVLADGRCRRSALALALRGGPGEHGLRWPELALQGPQFLRVASGEQRGQQRGHLGLPLQEAEPHDPRQHQEHLRVAVVAEGGQVLRDGKGPAYAVHQGTQRETSALVDNVGYRELPAGLPRAQGLDQASAAWLT